MQNPRTSMMQHFLAMTLREPIAVIWPIACLAALAGCSYDKSGAGPFGKPVPSTLLAPFAGSWVLDVERTYDAQRAAGATEKDIEELRS